MKKPFLFIVTSIVGIILFVFTAYFFTMKPFNQTDDTEYRRDLQEVTPVETFAPTQDQETNEDKIFLTNYYIFEWDDDRGVLIKSLDGKEIISEINYAAQYGVVYNSLKPAMEASEQWIYLDRAPDFNIGDHIEIRAESYIGRMNTPLIHRSTVTNIKDNALQFHPKIKQKMDHGIHIKQVLHQAAGFDSLRVEPTIMPAHFELKLTGETPFATVEVVFYLTTDSPMLHINITTTYKQDVQVFYEDLLLRFEPEVNKVYRKNRKTDTRRFQNTYWLDRQGVQFGEGNESALIYHTPEVSSLFLDTKDKQLTVHLDHDQDHRFFQAYETRSTGKVRHAAEYSRGEQRHNHLRILLGTEPTALPRLMLQPHGYLATHVWTEHADEGIMRSHRAVYYGSEQIMDADLAVGGFVKYQIPVTKSVFYSNIGYGKQHPIDVAIVEEPEFLPFLKDIYAQGSEIVLHSVHPRGSPTPELLEKALKFMYEHFKAKTWIDHGHINATFAFQALEKNSPHYIGKLWDTYDTKYFWHYSSEDITGTVQGSLDLLQTRNGDAARTPLYWKHPTVTEDFYSWAAAIVIDENFSVYTHNNLKELVQNWGVFINHTYPVRYNPSKSSTKYYTTTPQGILIVHPEFDRLLGRMATLRDRGELHLTTIHEILDYWIALENISYTYEPDGSVTLTNHSNSPIHGLSLAVRSPVVYVNGKKPKTKQVDDDLIFWFDLPASGRASISFSN